jgi:hypothetical protein
VVQPSAHRWGQVKVLGPEVAWGLREGPSGSSTGGVVSPFTGQAIGVVERPGAGELEGGGDGRVRLVVLVVLVRSKQAPLAACSSAPLL